MSSHKHHHIVLMLLFINAPVNAVLGLHCLSCSDAVAPTDCDTVQLCSAHESCFIEVYVLNTGHIRYKIGCRDIKQCTSIQSSGGRRDLHIVDSWDRKIKSQTNSTFPVASTTFTDSLLRNSTPVVVHRRSQELLVCSDCCTKDLCNSAGCGQTGYISQRGPICFHCSQQQTPDDCNKITMCGENQVCMLLKIPNEMTHVVRYQTHCEEENVCRNTENAVSLIIGKRQLGGGSCVASCCKTDLCNHQCSSTVAVISSTPQSSQTFTSNSVGTITPMLQNDHCLSNPCMRGTCSADQNTYRCTCEPGYVGQQCDQVSSPTTQSALTTQSSQITVTGLDACLSNPCMWGQCSPILTTYKCTCDHGYWGRNCEKDSSGSHSVTTSTIIPTSTTITPTTPPTTTTTIMIPTTKIRTIPTTLTTTIPTTTMSTSIPTSTIPTTMTTTIPTTTTTTMTTTIPTTTTIPRTTTTKTTTTTRNSANCVTFYCHHQGICVHYDCHCRIGYLGQYCETRDIGEIVMFRPGDIVVDNRKDGKPGTGTVQATYYDKKIITVKWQDGSIANYNNVDIDFA